MAERKVIPSVAALVGGLSHRRRAEKIGMKVPPYVQGYYCPPGRAAEIITWNRKFESLKPEQKANAKPKYFGMFIDLTPFCNFNCWFCYSDAILIGKRGSLPGKMPVLEWPDLKNIVEAAPEFGIQTITIAGRGEPTLDPNFLTLAKYANDSGLHFTVFTNTSSMTPELAKELAALEKVSVIAKLPSLDSSRSDEAVGLKGAGKKMVQGLAHLMEAGLHAPRLAIDNTLMRSNRDELKEVFRFCRKNNIIPYFELTLIKTGRASMNGNRLAGENLSDEERMRWMEEVRRIDETEFGFTWEYDNRVRVLGQEHCLKDQTWLTARNDGSVSSCVASVNSKFDNIHENSLADIILNSATLQKVRRGEYTPCEICSITCDIGNSRGAIMQR